MTTGQLPALVRRSPSRLARGYLAVLLVIGLLAPLLANDVPLLVRIDGTWSSPAFATWFGAPPPPPPLEDGVPAGSWKRWVVLRAGGSGDFAVMPPWPHGPGETGLGPAAAAPSLRHPLGLDSSGRDQLARLLHGAALATFVGWCTALLALLIGVPIGAFAGLSRVFDVLFQRLLEVFVAVPPLLFAMAATALLGASVTTLVLVLGLLFWTGVARIVRGELRSLRERTFVVTARGLGVGPVALFVRHLLPSLRGPIAVTAGFIASTALIVEATLSFLGLGVGLETVSWGAMVAEGRSHLVDGVWHLFLWPILILGATVLAIHGALDRAAITGLDR